MKDCFVEFSLFLGDNPAKIGHKHQVPCFLTRNQHSLTYTHCSLTITHQSSSKAHRTEAERTHSSRLPVSDLSPSSRPPPIKIDSISLDISI